jgi:hypothetical protein
MLSVEIAKSQKFMKSQRPSWIGKRFLVEIAKIAKIPDIAGVSLEMEIAFWWNFTEIPEIPGVPFGIKIAFLVEIAKIAGLPQIPSAPLDKKGAFRLKSQNFKKGLRSQ